MNSPPRVGRCSFRTSLTVRTILCRAVTAMKSTRSLHALVIRRDVSSPWPEAAPGLINVPRPECFCHAAEEPPHAWIS